MLSGTLGFVSDRQPHESPIQIGVDTTFDWETRVSVDFIRHHAKIDDVPAVTDDQIRLYRASAVEAAQEYTGLLLSGQRTVSEPVAESNRKRLNARKYTFKLQYPSYDGYVYLYGGANNGQSATLRIKPGTRKVEVPLRYNDFDLQNCCDPCSAGYTGVINGGMMVAYRAGYKSVNDVPSTVVLGMMQFMTWCIEHPGDELLTQRNRVETRAGLAGLQGSNNIAMISGALETWRVIDPDAV